MFKPRQKRVYICLLKNAIENIPDEGKIGVAIRSEDNEIRIDIHDYGVGIPPKTRR